MSAILFGSLSTLADTSELQREAFNKAFQQHGLDWSWDRDEYRELLRDSGGAKRIAAYAESQGNQEVDAEAVHKTKSELFQASVAESALSARPGVAETAKGAREAGYKLALVTSTSPENIEALFGALGDDLAAEDFDLIVDATKVEQSKPDPAAYGFALSELGEDAGACVAIEDNVPGVEAAKAAGVACVAFPNENTAAHDFAAADSREESVEFGRMQALAADA